MAFIMRSSFKTGLQRNICSAAQMRCASKDDTNLQANSNTTEKYIQISEDCTKRLQEICTDGSFLRIVVEGGGCSGFQYKFDLDTKINDDDLQFGKDNAKVVIDTTSLEYCSGAIVDYHTELIRSGFRMLANPLAEQGCSCGSSFSIKL